MGAVPRELRVAHETLAACDALPSDGPIIREPEAAEFVIAPCPTTGEVHGGMD